MSLLVAGATGFLGLAVVTHASEAVVAVVRAGDPEQRGRSLGRRLGADVSAVTGDVRTPGWGLGDALERLRGEVRLVVNVAGQASWAAGWNDLMAINVDGARHGVDVAAALGVPLLHVSSIFAAFAAEPVVREQLVLEQASLTKYERSKCRGEWAVADRAEALGVPATIARVGGLIGDLGDPCGGKVVAPPLARLVDSPVVPYARGARLDVSPRDLVAQRLLTLPARTSPGVVVRHIGQGAAAPLVSTVLHEVAERTVGDSRPIRPVAVPARVLLRASAVADRALTGPRANVAIGLRYFASPTVYESEGLGRDVAMASLVHLFRRDRPVERAARVPDFYAGWV